MRCDSIMIIGDDIEINGISYTVITGGPLDPKTGCYELIAKFKVSQELMNELIKIKTLNNGKI